MSGAESASVNPHYTSGKLPSIPQEGPFTLATVMGERLPLVDIQKGGEYKKKHIRVVSHKKRHRRRTLKKHKAQYKSTRNKRRISTRKHS
jgi:hypothetical protein